MNHKLISKKKQVYPVLPALQDYLDQHGRAMSIPVTYEDLLRFGAAWPFWTRTTATPFGWIASTLSGNGMNW